MKNWMISTSGELVFIIKDGNNTRNQSIIRVASISKNEIIRYRSNKVPKWIIEEAIDVLKIDDNPSDVYAILKTLKVGKFARIKRRNSENNTN